jgi:hypothetical protein
MKWQALKVLGLVGNSFQFSIVVYTFESQFEIIKKL